MALGVLNNLSAIYAENNLNNTNNSLQTVLEQLSSGSKINSGADDAAGLSVGAGDGHAVEIPVPALDDLHRLRSVIAVLQLAKVVQRGQGAAGSDFESRAGVSTVVSSGGGCAVEVAVGCQYQPNRGVGAIRAGKVVQHSHGLCGRIQRHRGTKYKRDEGRFQ